MAKKIGTKTAAEKYTVEEVEKALIKSGGFISYAAKLLRCRQSTLREYIAKYPQLRDVMEEIKTAELDASELALLKKRNQGDNTAIIFHLKCKGKDRGYVEYNAHAHAVVDPGSASWKDLVEKAFGTK